MSTLDLSILGYDRDRASRFFSALEERVKAIPGVNSVTLTSGMPLGPGHRSLFRVSHIDEPCPVANRRTLMAEKQRLWRVCGRHDFPKSRHVRKALLRASQHWLALR